MAIVEESEGEDEGKESGKKTRMKEAAGSQIAMKPGTDASHKFHMTSRPPMTMLFFLCP